MTTSPDEFPYAELGEALYRCRRTAGLSLRTLARKLNMSAHSGLVDYERGKRLIPEDLLTRYERIFDDGGGLRRLRTAVLAAQAGRSAIRFRIAQLPADLPDFVGRKAELDILQAAAEAAVPAPGLLVVTGPPGMGKTSLAVHLAHRLAGRYPDGQLYLDLRGADESPVPPADALRWLLRGLDIADRQPPTDTAELAAWYRSILDGRRVLLLLDNVADEGQGRPLLPGAAGALAVLTSRNPLLGLDGAVRCQLDSLSTAESVDLIGRVVGTDRVANEPEAAARIADSCAGLPLATRIAAARLGNWPRWSLADCARMLAAEQRRLTWLSTGDRAVRGTFEMSYRALSDPARRLFRRLALLPVPECGLVAAAVLAGTSESGADSLLTNLVNVGLVQPALVGNRYRLHDLTALYASDRLSAEEDEGATRTAEEAYLDWLLGTAQDAATQLDESGANSGTSVFAGSPDAVRWLDTERVAVRAGIARAAALDLADLVYPLMATLPWFYDLRCHWQDQRDLAETTLELARRRGDATMEVMALNGIALAWTPLRRPDEVIRWSVRAMSLARRVDAVEEETWALDRWGMALTELGRYEEARVVLLRAAALAQEYGDWWMVGGALNRLGHVSYEARRHESAIDAYDQALLVFRELDRPRGEAMARIGLGRALAALGRPDEAVTYQRTAVALFAGADDGWGLARAHQELAAALRALGQYQAAAERLRLAAGLFADHGDRHAQARTLLTFVELAVAESRYVEASRCRDEALAALAGLTDPEARDLRAALAVPAGAPGPAADR
ncbi:tetratricopeptide repeat protein [Micromonosporaceae bacterium B7E4]